MDSHDKIGMLEAELTSVLFDKVRRFWFQHIKDDQHIVVPSKDDAKKWFSRDESFDEACRTEFGAVLSLIRKLNVNGPDLLAAATPNTPLDWMALIILLDQIPRNCYRDDEASVAYTFFDPIALHVAFKAIERDVPRQPDVHYRHAYRFWFYMPLEHSEELEIQKKLALEHDKMFSESHRLADEESSCDDAPTLYCRKVLLERKDAWSEWENTIRGIATAHAGLIESFGRYPHRNQALKRESTREELDHLQNPSRT
ncbi:hypothetical protein NM208_g1257 [Fusarium decemcellulare]|uniref:Uncharacterized protein n=1 Tax=Fusarium decemcellulare TaxID=57161 RepID=A0ACC1SXB1_9HYPO|nr:hypothetical protein NM208_g1257 [Fusarium decemcellulare]